MKSGPTPAFVLAGCAPAAQAWLPVSEQDHAVGAYLVVAKPRRAATSRQRVTWLL